MRYWRRPEVRAIPIKLPRQLKRRQWLTRSNFLWATAAIVGLGVAIALVAALATGSLKAGIGAGTTTVTSEKTDSQGKVIKRTITSSTQDAKILWNWLSLLVVPASLARLGTLLQLKPIFCSLILVSSCVSDFRLL
jgi:hypothetical protein